MGLPNQQSKKRDILLYKMDLHSNNVATQQQQPMVVIVQAPVANTRTPDVDHFKKFFPKKAVMGMSIAMIIAGALSAILQMVLIFGPYYGFTAIAQGIWCGVFFIITGGLGMAAANKPSDCSIITLMVLSIISAVMAVPHMVFDGIGASSPWRYHFYHDKVETVLYSFLFILGLAAAIISIVLSSYTCRAICCRRINAGSVIYNPSGVGATAQTIPMGNLDFSKADIVPQPATAAATTHQLPPSYNKVTQLQMHQPPSAPPMVGQTDLENRPLINGNFQPMLIRA